MGEAGGGLDLVTSSHRRPLALVRRPRRSGDDYLSPRWSPDGSHIAFHAVIGHREGLYVMRADGTARRRVARGSISEFAWSPNSTTLAFVAACEIYSPSDGLTRGCRHGRIEIVSRGGGRRRVVAHPPEVRAESDIQVYGWSPAGTELLYHVVAPGPDRLYAIDLGSRRPRVLASSPDEGQIGEASWSPDGRLIAYTRRCEENRIGDVFCDVAVMSADGRSKRTLRRRGIRDAFGPSWQAPTWIPRSTFIVFNEVGQKGGLVRIDVRSGATKLLTRDYFGEMRTSVDGRTIGGLIWDGFVVARSDGSVLARLKVRGGCSVGSCDLWLR